MSCNLSLTLIKRDKTALKVFKDEQYWLSFKRNLMVTARAQNVERIFDVEFDSTTLSGPDLEMYHLQLKYGYAALTRVVQTHQGQIYVCDHEDDGDASAVMKESTNYYTTSRVAEVAAGDLEI